MTAYLGQKTGMEMSSHSEMTHLDKSLQQRVSDFCRTHAADFDLELNDYVRRYFLKSRATLFVAAGLLTIGPLSSLKTGQWILSISYLPVVLMFVVYSLFSNRIEVLNRRAALYVDLINKVSLLTTAWCFYIYHSTGNMDKLASASPLVMMIITWAMNVSVGIWRNAINAVLSTAFFLGCLAYFEPHYIFVNVGSLTTGAIIGAVLQSLLFRLFRYKFYFGQQEKNLRNHAYKQLEKVLYPHQRRMIEDGYTLEETMPVGWGEACVIAFDVVESSKIKSPYARTLLQNVLKKCQTIMMQNYNSADFESNAYRIKEMGDGFLCSIGFPFKVPGTWQKESLAIKLAQQFVTIFHEEAAKLAPNERIHCSIGIANGVIEAFYPHTTPKEYDIYGRPLILATRYENIRKELFNHIPKSSIIVLQEPVYMRLPPQLQQGFVQFELKNFRIRDDQEAKRLFYMVFDQQGHPYVRPPNLATQRIVS